MPQGTHQAFVKDVVFVQNRKDARKKNLRITYEVNEPGSKAFGKTIDEYKASNPFDDEQTKGFLVDRLMSLGVSREELASTNPRSLIGLPVFVSVGPQKNNPQYMQVNRVTLIDSERVSVAQPPVGNGTGNSPTPVSAGSLDY
jgi:hypothetical protein